MNQTKKIIKIKSKKTTPKTYAYECEVCEGTQFTHPKFYCPQCEQEMCPCCSGEIMKCREGIFEGQTVCLTCYNNPEFEEGRSPRKRKRRRLPLRFTSESGRVRTNQRPSVRQSTRRLSEPS